MAAPIVGGIIAALADALGAEVWDGEIPRQGVTQTDINLTADTPVFKVDMLGDMSRNWTLANAYDDQGPIGVWTMSTTRAACETLLTQIETWLALDTNWALIDIGTKPANYVISVLLASWSCKQLEGARTKASQLIYVGSQNFAVDLHGTVPTRPV